MDCRVGPTVPLSIVSVTLASEETLSDFYFSGTSRVSSISPFLIIHSSQGYVAFTFYQSHSLLSVLHAFCVYFWLQGDKSWRKCLRVCVFFDETPRYFKFYACAYTGYFRRITQIWDWLLLVLTSTLSRLLFLETNEQSRTLCWCVGSLRLQLQMELVSVDSQHLYWVETINSKLIWTQPGSAPPGMLTRWQQAWHRALFVQSLGWMLGFTMVDRSKAINPKNVMFAQFAEELGRKLIC